MRSALSFHSTKIEKPEDALQEALAKIFKNEIYCCPVFYKHFSIGIVLTEYTPEVRLDIEKLISLMDGTEWEVANYESAAATLERCAKLMRVAGKKAAARYK